MNNIIKKPEIKLCSVEGCGEVHVSRGYCKSHYYRYKKYGNPLEVRQVQSKNTEGNCKVHGCAGTHNAKGYCKIHYRKWARYGDPLYEHPTECRITECDAPIEARGLCQKHYRRLRVHGNPQITLRKVDSLCIIRGCKNKNRRNGYCQSHWVKTDLFRDNHRMYSAKRRSLQLNAPINDFSRNDWEEILDIFNNECAYCGSVDNIEQEHVIPLSKGGSHTASNIVPACRSCNSSKRQRLIEKWYSQQTFYDKEKERKILKWMGYKIDDNKIQTRLF